MAIAAHHQRTVGVQGHDDRLGAGLRLHRGHGLAADGGKLHRIIGAAQTSGLAQVTEIEQVGDDGFQLVGAGEDPVQELRLHGVEQVVVLQLVL